MGILFFIIGAIILLLHSLDLLKGSVNWQEMAAAFVVLGVAFAGIALPLSMPSLQFKRDA